MERWPTLADAPVRVPVRVGRPALSAALVRRLAELGLRHGATATVLHRSAGGGRIVAIGHDRLALDGQTAAAIPLWPGAA